MGKASSAKKVARAARSGGKTAGQRRNLGFPAAIVAIVILGVGLVAFARQNTPGGGSPALGEHWHAAYGIYVCDRWVADLPDGVEDPLGIHTHEDGLIHIHPFLAGAAGRSATLGRFFEQVGVDVGDSSITLPPGDQFGERQYRNGETTCGDEEGRVVMAYWADAQDTSGRPDALKTSSISGENFDDDLSAFTIAFLPEGETPPPPPSAANILQGAAVDGPIDTEPNEDATEEDLQGQFGGEGGETPGEAPPVESSPIEPPSETEPPGSTEPPGDPEPTGSTEAPAETTAPAGG